MRFHFLQTLQSSVSAFAIFFLATSDAMAAPTAPVAAPPHDSVPSFRHDVLPILTRYGCNQGACHGKLAGQNGFRLSLRGYAPEQDFDWITREYQGRRLNLASPAQSALLTKPTLGVRHEGGKLFDEKSRAYQTLHAWIAAGAPASPLPSSPFAAKNKPAKPEDEASVAKLEIREGQGPGAPGDKGQGADLNAVGAVKTMRVGESFQLGVTAIYTDGRSRDVAWLTQFFSSDLNVATVSADGLVTAKHPGEAAIRVQFADQVKVVIVSIPYDRTIDEKELPPAANAIDTHVFAKLKALRIPLSPLCDDATFLRRAYLDTIGTLPTPETVESFLKDARADKRARLVDELLSRPEWADYWTLVLADQLQNRRERDHDVRGSKGVRSFHYWLRAQLAANKAWHQIARDVLTAAGDAGEHPQVGYYVTVVGEKRPADKSEVVGSVAQAFLGTRIGCAQCHNHPSEKYTQDDYYHFAAFFSRVSMERADMYKAENTGLVVATNEERDSQKRIAQIEKKIAELEAAAAGTETAKADEKKKQIENERKQLESAKKELDQRRSRMPTSHQPRTNAQLVPQPLDRAAMTFEPSADPRVALVDWMTNPTNEQFAGNMVNRIWKHFLRTGLVEPVDDLRSSNPPTNPALWKMMTQDFVAKGYDLKYVMRMILNSRTYQSDSATVADNELDEKFYSRFYPKRLPAEVLLDAVCSATLVPDSFPGYPQGLRAIQLPDHKVDSYFLGLFGRSDRVTACACDRSNEVTLPQLLHMQNGEILQKVKHNDSRLAKLLRDKTDERAMIDALFVAALCRKPSDKERDQVIAALAGTEDRSEAMQDLFWALLNTKEFSFNH